LLRLEDFPPAPVLQMDPLMGVEAQVQGAGQRAQPIGVSGDT
jgi:hypothetical protein